MISLLSLVRYFTTAFTFYIDGGIGEAALIGAAFGGAKAIATGQDPLQAALLGGVTGGAMGGISSLLPGAASAVDAGVTTTGSNLAPTLTNATLANATPEYLKQGLTQGVEQGVGQGITQGVEQGVGQGITQGAQQLTNSGITGYGGMQPIANAAPDVATSFVPPPVNVSADEMRQFGAQQAAQQGTQQAVQQAVATPASNPFEQFKNYVNPTAGGTADKYLTMAANNPEIAGGVLGYGYGVATQKPPTVQPIPKEKSKLAGFNADEFTPYVPATPNPYYNAHYAEGGIAALAQGGMDSPGISTLGMGGNQAYPGGRLDTTQFATPTQMPTSSSVINSDYEMKTNPYTGEPSPGMAEGGVARYAYGGYASDMGMNGQQQNATGYNGTGGKFGDLINHAQQAGISRGDNLGSNFQSTQAIPNVYQPTQADQTPSYNPNPAQAAVSAVASPSYDTMMQGVAPQDFNRVFGQVMNQNQAPQQPVKMAQGGGIGSLGGYAHGGNPQLLDGPGDGMSDSIPASIGNRQPARLAQGEFVVPADVVSHLGNGSTDAGAKHLYAMMDKVRQARTGNKKQGKQINSAMYLPK